MNDHGATVTVHHIARLAQLGPAGSGQPAWAALMARKRRKTLIICRRRTGTQPPAPVLLDQSPTADPGLIPLTIPETGR